MSELNYNDVCLWDVEKTCEQLQQSANISDVGIATFRTMKFRGNELACITPEITNQIFHNKDNVFHALDEMRFKHFVFGAAFVAEEQKNMKCKSIFMTDSASTLQPKPTLTLAPKLAPNSRLFLAIKLVKLY